MLEYVMCQKPLRPPSVRMQEYERVCVVLQWGREGAKVYVVNCTGFGFQGEELGSKAREGEAPGSI